MTRSAVIGTALVLALASGTAAAQEATYNIRTLTLRKGQMINDGLLLEEAEPFDTLIERCARIAERVDQASK